MVSSLGRRFARAGLLRRTGGVGAGSSAPDPDVPLVIFGADLIHEYDAEQDITIATGVSQWGDQIGTDHLVQATAGRQPTYTANGATSYLEFDGSDDRIAVQSIADFGGDVTLLVVGQYLTAAAADTIFSGSAALGAIVHVSGAPVGGFTAAVRDATGTDAITSATAGDTALHAFVLRNETGVVRKFHVDGGAGASGARTDATLALTNIVAGAGGVNGGSSHANCRLYYGAIVNPSPSVADLNLWGAWAAWRFGITWATLS